MYDVIKKSKYSDRVRDVLPELKEFMGRRVSTEISDRLAYCKDFNPLHLRSLLNRKIPALPDAVVFPTSIEEVSKILQILNSYSIPVYIFGGSSGVIDANTPYCGGIALSTLGLDWIKIDSDYMVVEVGAGVVGGKLESILNHEGYTLRHIPQSLYCSTVGGWIATKASGQFSTGYGSIEDIVLDMTIVTPSGEILKGKRLPRKASVDLKNIFIGSEGSFGVVCSAELMIRDIPSKQYKMAFLYESMDMAVEDAEILLKSFKPALLRIFDKLESLKIFDIEGVVVLVIIEGENADEEKKFVERVLRGEFIGENAVDRWLEKRFDVSDISKFVPKGIIFDTIEVSCFWKNAMSVYRGILKAIRDVDGTLLATCHASHFYEDGLCFYFTFAGISSDYEAYYRRVWESAMNTALKLGASLSHHHGIGNVRQKWLSKELLGYYTLFIDLKSFFDPRNIMNRGLIIKDC